MHGKFTHLHLPKRENQQQIQQCEPGLRPVTYVNQFHITLSTFVRDTREMRVTFLAVLANNLAVIKRVFSAKKKCLLEICVPDFKPLWTLFAVKPYT